MRWADQAAQQHGVDAGLLKSLISHESGWKRNARSPAGALGLGQFMPATARSLGINPLDPRQAIFGAAKYLAGKIKRYGDVRLALASYNAGDGAVQKYGGVPPYKETQDYVRKVMRDAGIYKSPGHVADTPARGGTPGTPGFTVETPDAPDLAGVAMANLGQMSSQGGHYDPLMGLSNLVNAIAASGSTSTHVAGTPGTAAPAAAPSGDWAKFVRLASGADRGGVHTQAPIKQFVGQLGAALNRPLTITTGTNHDRMTVNGNVSAHWGGNAADIAMSGAALTRAGRRALVLAGMPASQARKAKGGIYNVGGYQIIFNTREGGNHWNHLHVGIHH